MSLPGVSVITCAGPHGLPAIIPLTLPAAFRGAALFL